MASSYNLCEGGAWVINQIIVILGAFPYVSLMALIIKGKRRESSPNALTFVVGGGLLTIIICLSLTSPCIKLSDNPDLS